MNNVIDFGQPKRLDNVGFFVEGVVSFVNVLKRLWILIAILIFRHPEVFKTWQFQIGIGVFFVGIIVYAYLNHRNIRYYVNEDSGEFILERGVFNKSKVVLKLDNIQQVNVKQGIVQQALDLYSVEIESAGSKEKEVDLYALDEQTALSLKSYLLGGLSDGYAVIDQAENTQQETIFHIPNRHIFAVSLLTNYKQGLALFFAFMVALFDQVREFFSTSDMYDMYDEADFSFADLFLFGFIAILLILFVPIVINVFRYFIRYYGFSLNKTQKGNLIMHYGLFNINDVILNRTKVQMIVSTKNKILKWMRLNVLALHQVITDASKADNAIVLMPGISDASRVKLWESIFKVNVYDTVKLRLKPAIGLFISRMVKSTVFFLVLFLASYYVIDSTYYSLEILSVFYVLSVVYNAVYYRNYTFSISDDYLIKQEGFWDIKEFIIPIDKLIAIDVSQTIFQRRSQTANLGVSTASGEVLFRFFEKRDLTKLSNQLLYRIERKI